MKHKHIAFTTMLLLVVALPVFARAESTSTGSSKRVELKTLIDAKHGETRTFQVNARATTSATSSKGEMRANMNPGISRGPAMMVAGVKAMFDRAIARLEQIAARIDSRIEKLEDAGGDVTAAETALTAAQADIANAKTHVKVFASLDVTATSTMKTNFEKVRAEAKSAHESLKSARENLRKAVQELKKIEVSGRVKTEVE